MMLITVISFFLTLISLYIGIVRINKNESHALSCVCLSIVSGSVFVVYFVDEYGSAIIRFLTMKVL